MRGRDPGLARPAPRASRCGAGRRSSSAIVISVRSWSSANTRSSSAAGHSPSSFCDTISHSAPAGAARPAGRGRPRPRCARAGAAPRPRGRAAAARARAAPGRRRPRAGSASIRIVWARSAAEMPVVTPALRVDGHGEGRAEAVAVGVVHRRQVQPVALGLGQRHADVARGVADHERQQLRASRSRPRRSGRPRSPGPRRPPPPRLPARSAPADAPGRSASGRHARRPSHLPPVGHRSCARTRSSRSPAWHQLVARRTSRSRPPRG